MKRAASPSALKKHIQDSPKLRELRRKRGRSRRRLFVLLAILFATLLGGSIYAARYEGLLLRHIEVSGNQVTSTDEIIQIVESHLGGNYVFVYPKRNAFLYDRAGIREELTASFPRLRDISVSRKNLTTIAISVNELRGISLWCGSVEAASLASTKCYFTDESGLIIDKAPHYSGSVYHRFFGGSLISIDDDPLGKRFISADEFGRFVSFAEGIEGLGFHIESIIVGPGEEGAFVLDLGVHKNAELRFRTNDDYGVLLSNLSAAIGKAELAKKLEENKTQLQYFDLRFSNKVYYKFSNE